MGGKKGNSTKIKYLNSVYMYLYVHHAAQQSLQRLRHLDCILVESLPFSLEDLDECSVCGVPSQQLDGAVVILQVLISD